MPSRVDGIDVLRGLSILAVILLHIDIRLALEKSALGHHLSRQILQTIVWNGANGVTIFFAISGFLITSTCFRRWGKLQSISLATFYRIRFARIAPPLFGLLGILCVLHWARVSGYTIDPKQTSLGRAVLSALTFHLNWLEAAKGYLPANWDVLWSLSVEEMFYLFFPILCLLCRNLRALVLVLLAFVVTGPFARTVFTSNEMWADHSYLSCMDGIALGCLAAIAAHELSWRPRALFVLRATGTAMMIFILMFHHQAFQLGIYQCGLDMTILALGTSLVLIAMAQRAKPGSRFTTPLRWFGRNSYEVYLSHVFVVLGFLQLSSSLKLDNWIPLWYAAIVAVSGLLGAAIAKLYSEPLNRKLRPAHRSVSSSRVLSPAERIQTLQ